MAFLQPLSKTAPEYRKELPWPIDGLAYVVALAGPLCGAASAGLLTKTWTGAFVGVTVGAAITLAHAWLSDTFIDPWVARFQVTLNRRMPWVFINVLAFSWAIALSAVAMFGTWAILAGQDILPVP
jgi:hypothetical protein